MLNNIYTTPLDSRLAEQGVYNTAANSLKPIIPGVPATPGGYDSSGINPNNMYTGGNLPATVAGGVKALPATSTGGPLPATVGPVMHTGGPLPATQGTPPGQVPVVAAPPTDINTILNQIWGAQGGNAGQADPSTLANQYMTNLLSQDNPYIRSARQAGMEQANARGLMNSSIAAGSSERAAVDAAMPMFQSAYALNSQRENNNFQGAMQRTQLGMNLLGQREQNAFTGDQNSLDRSFQGTQAQLDRNLKTKLQSDAVYQQDWLSNQDFTRQFNSALSMIPIQNASDFSKLVQQYALENPEVYTPEMISGMTAFFSQNMASIMQQYFPKLKGA